MIFRSILGPAFFIGIIAWFVWVLLPMDACTRIERSGSPLRVGSSTLAFVFGPWSEKETKDGMVKWGESADMWFRSLIAKQFFDSISCENKGVESNASAEGSDAEYAHHQLSDEEDYVTRENKQWERAEPKKHERVMLADPLTGESIVVEGGGE